MDLAQIPREVFLIDFSTGMAAHKDEIEMLAKVEETYGFSVYGP